MTTGWVGGWVQHTVLLGRLGVIGVVDGVIGYGWERDFMLLGRRSFLLPIASA
jgi:hypothetical protein